MSPPRIKAVLRPVNLPSCGKRERLRLGEGERTRPAQAPARARPSPAAPVPGRHTSLVNFMVCRASSRVGERMRARAPVWALRALSRSNMGMRKQAVLPLPVRAMATTSLPSRITGMVWGEMSERGVRSSPAPKHHMTSDEWANRGISVNGKGPVTQP